MIILDATTKSLQFKLSGTVATNQLPFAASYVSTTGTATTPTEQDGVSNNTTAVTLVSAPASSTQITVKNIVIQNADTVAATVTIIYNNNSTLRNIFVATLAVGDQLIYEDGYGWMCVDSGGHIKTSAGVSSVTNSDGSLTISPTTGSVVASLAQMPAGTVKMNNTSSLATPANVPLSSVVIPGFVNKLRNGTFDIWQRGTSSISVSTSGAYVADGWIVVPTGASCTAGQASDNRSGALALYGLKMVGASSVTDILVKQRIESYIAAAIAGQTVTFSAWVYNNTGGSITPKISTKYAGSTDVWTSPTTDLSATNVQACPNAAWTQIAYTFAASASAVNGYEVDIDFGNNFSSSSNYVIIAEADFRATPNVATGTNSTPPIPELRPIAAELPFNQRYFATSYGNDVAPASATHAGMVSIGTGVGSGDGVVTSAQFPVQMRVVPTVSIYDGAGNSGKTTSVSGTSFTDNTTPAGYNLAFQISTSNFLNQFSNAIGSGNTYLIHYAATAEL